MDIEDRIFELLGEHISADELLDHVTAEYGVSRSQAAGTARKVVRERGTPGLVAVRWHIERLGRNPLLTRA